MDERRGYDDAGAEVFCNEKCPFWNTYAPVIFCVYRECRACILSVIRRVERARRTAPEGMPSVPNNEPKSITKMAETRRPIRPSKSLSERHAGVVATVAAAADADGSASRRTTLAMACIPSFLPAQWVALSVPGYIDARSQSSALARITFSKTILIVAEGRRIRAVVQASLPGFASPQKSKAGRNGKDSGNATYKRQRKKKSKIRPTSKKAICVQIKR